MEANPRRFPGLRLLAAKYLGLSFTWTEWEKHASYYEPAPPPRYNTRGCLSAARPARSRAPGTDRARLLPPAPPGRPRSPAPAAPPAGAGRGAGGQSRPALGVLRPGDPCAGARPRVASWGPAGRLQPREAGERPPGLGRVAASVPPLGVAGEEASLPAEPRAPGFAWDVRGEGGGLYGRGSFPASLACSCSQTRPCRPVWRSGKGSSSASPKC